jgi:hypothetical protein
MLLFYFIYDECLRDKHAQCVGNCLPTFFSPSQIYVEHLLCMRHCASVGSSHRTSKAQRLDSLSFDTKNYLAFLLCHLGWMTWNPYLLSPMKFTNTAVH